MRVGFDDFGSDPDIREGRKGLLLHECIHAMQDNRNALWMRVDTAEAAAYTAQCLFHRACGRTQGELTGLVSSAWEATERILRSRQRSVAENDIPHLMTAIRTHHTYASEFDRTGRYDGIERPRRERNNVSGGCSVSAFDTGAGAQLARILAF